MRNIRTVILTGALVAAGLFLLVTTSRANQSVSASIQAVHDMPATKVMRLGSHIVKLDTRTGSVHLLRGSGGARGSGDEWTLRVSAVKGATSGMLDVQRVSTDATETVFLVDIDGERTWILKWRGNENGEWQEVQTSSR